jgi:hypothetical protein
MDAARAVCGGVNLDIRVYSPVLELIQGITSEESRSVGHGPAGVYTLYAVQEVVVIT